MATVPIAVCDAHSHSERSGADVRCDFADASLRVRVLVGAWVRKPENGPTCGIPIPKQALTQSLSRNDTELDYLVYCGGVPRIPGSVRRLVGPLRSVRNVALEKGEKQ